MGETPCELIGTILESVQQELDDPELSFKLRTARQLLLVCEEQHLTYRSTLESADLDEATTQRLVELGYL